MTFGDSLFVADLGRRGQGGPRLLYPTLLSGVLISCHQTLFLGSKYLRNAVADGAVLWTLLGSLYCSASQTFRVGFWGRFAVGVGRKGNAIETENEKNENEGNVRREPSNRKKGREEKARDGR